MRELARRRTRGHAAQDADEHVRRFRSMVATAAFWQRIRNSTAPVGQVIRVEQ